MNITQQIDSCTECDGNLRHDRKHAHAFCADCGLVIEQSDLRLSRGKGDGTQTTEDSLKDATRPEHRYNTVSLQTKQGWSRKPAETTFYADGKDGNNNSLPKYADGGRNLEIKRNYQWQWQHGYRDGGEKARLKDKLAAVEVFADTLHVNDAIEKRAKRLAYQVGNASGFNQWGGFYGLALGCIAVAENGTIETQEDFENRIQVREYEWREDNTPLFKELAERHGIEWRKAIAKVKKKTAEWRGGEER